MDALPSEFQAGERLRSYLLHNPIVVTDDPNVKRLVAEMDLTEMDDPNKVGSELLFSWISPAEYGAAIAEVSVLSPHLRFRTTSNAFSMRHASVTLSDSIRQSSHSAARYSKPQSMTSPSEPESYQRRPLSGTCFESIRPTSAFRWLLVPCFSMCMTTTKTSAR